MSEFIRERSARAESESFTLDKLRHRSRLRLLDLLRCRAFLLQLRDDLRGQAIIAARAGTAGGRGKLPTG